MAWATAPVTKIDVLHNLEAWFDPADPQQLTRRYDEAIAALEHPEPRHWLALAERAGVDKGSAAHFRAHWLGEGDRPYWAGMVRADAAEKIRTGFRDAMVTARDRRLPISYVWVTPPGLAKDYFEVAHVAGPHGVTAVIITATPDVPAKAE